MRPRIPRILWVALAATALLPLHAAEPAPAAVAAPAITKLDPAGLPTHWLQGEPLRAFEPGVVYVFEFWATWCGPCIQAMPHMESLHRHFEKRKDVRITGVNVMDRVAPEKLMPFLKTRKLDITYPMAVDTGDRPVQTRWLKPLGIDGIPHTLVVKDGAIIWRGHPTALNADLLDGFSKSGYRAGGPKPKTKADLRRELRPKVDAALGKAFRSDRAGAHKDLRVLVVETDDAGVSLPLLVEGMAILARAEADAEALALARLIIELYPDNRDALRAAGDFATASGELLERDLPFGLTCADRMLALDPNDRDALALKAEGLYRKGDRDAAIAIQTRLVETSPLRLRIQKLRTENAEASR